MMARLSLHSFYFDTSALAFTALAVLIASIPSFGEAQTSIVGPEVDVEIVNPSDGTNDFCVGPGESLTARLFIRPGTATTSCTPACGTIVDGGPSHLATAVIDIAYQHQKLNLEGTTKNTGTAAADGLVQDNSAEGRLGWALAGDWTPNATVSGTLANPCEMQLLESADWVLEMIFTADPTASGLASFHLRRERDGFALSFADICGQEAMTEANGNIDEIVDGTVLISPSCADVLFFDGFESRLDFRWSSSTIR